MLSRLFPGCVLTALWTAIAACSSSAVAGEKLSPGKGPPSPSLLVEAGSPARGARHCFDDHSTLPARYPKAAWVPLKGPLLPLELKTAVWVNGRKASAVLDTGAMSTVMSVPVAVSLGLVGHFTPKGKRVRVLDAHGDTLEGERLPLGSIEIGGHRFTDVSVLVIGDHPELFLVGHDILQHIDLYIAGEQGLLGLFDAGTAPILPGAMRASLERGDRQLQVRGVARSTKGSAVNFSLIVDTGASFTTVPAFVGVNGGLPADLRFQSRTFAVGGANQNRGRFVLDPLRLGPEQVSAGKVLAMASLMQKGEGPGLLGNDVFMGHHTIISHERGALLLVPLEPRPPTRSAALPQPQGATNPCVSVSVEAQHFGKATGRDLLAPVCLRTRIDDDFAGKTVQLLVTARDEQRRPLFGGGGLTLSVTVGPGGYESCVQLMPELAALGVDENTSVELRWVRSEGFEWPCAPELTHCMSFTGPLAPARPK